MPLLEPGNSQKDQMSQSVPETAAAAVLTSSEPLPEGTPIVKGYGFESDAVNYDELLGSFLTSGFQATHFGRAVNIVNDMLAWKPSKKQIDDGMSPDAHCRIFLGYTSNMISSGMRDSLRYLVKNKQVDVLVTSAGGVEEDLIKCLGPTGVGSFKLDGENLRKRGLNRIGNLLVPNYNYCKFEEWIMPVLDEALQRQKSENITWTPSTLIKFLGERIDNEDSVCYWAAKNNIPIFCPALTDGSLGDMLFFHSYKSPGLIVDLVQDIRGINKLALDSDATGMIILGGGVIKHHIANANLMRNGAEFSVYINTGQEFDGSDAGASPDEAVSWGKIKGGASKVKVCTDATLVFPLLVAQTFAKHKRVIK